MSSSNDLEMNDVKAPLMTPGGDMKTIPDVEIKGSKQSLNVKKIEEFHGLTKEELEKFANDPFWKKLRLILFILFWIAWVGMLVAAILIVVFSPKCPKRPKLQFWEQKTGYWLDPFAYTDTNNDGVGDFQGIISKLDYIQKEVGAGYIILDPAFKGQYNANNKLRGLVENFKELDSKLGTKDSFLELVKEARKRGIEIVLTADFNSLADTSSLLKNEKEKWLVIPENEMKNWKNRNGMKISDSFYSVFPGKYDLNLKSETVLKEIKESVKMWLEAGVRGFLMTNVPLYVENSTIPSSPTNYGTQKAWYDSQATFGQIYSKETQTFLREIRKTMDEVAKATDKSRLLIVEAGNIGYGLDKSDNLLQYLGDNENLADMIVGREFLHNRGWKIDGLWNESSVKNYLDIIPTDRRNRIALTSATSTNIRTTDLIKLASTFLVQGNPILYYGSELGLECDTTSSTTSNFYPENMLFEDFSETSSKCNHMIMPWDNTGEGFSNGIANFTNPYIKQSQITVQSLTAIGFGETVLHLTKNFIGLRKLPSLQWGSMSSFYNVKTSVSSHEIFTRQAEGFPKIIVALLKDKESNGKVFSFKSICEKLSPILVYPSNSNLELKKEIDSSKIYLKMSITGSIHVFQCS